MTDEVAVAENQLPRRLDFREAADELTRLTEEYRTQPVSAAGNEEYLKGAIGVWNSVRFDKNQKRLIEEALQERARKHREELRNTISENRALATVRDVREPGRWATALIGINNFRAEGVPPESFKDVFLKNAAETITFLQQLDQRPKRSNLG